MFRDFIILTRSKWRFVEIFYFPLTGMIIWGFFALYAQELALEAGLILLVVNLFWNFAYVAQSTANLQITEDTWSGSLKQVLLSGINEFEYIIARLITASLMSILVMLLMLAVSYAFAPVLIVHAAEFFILGCITLLASVALAVLVAAIYIGSGREYAFLAWTALQAFILFSSPFYPFASLPKAAQFVVAAMPFTFIFEASRSLVVNGTAQVSQLWYAALVSVLYFILSWPIYYFAFRRARRTGGLVKIS